MFVRILLFTTLMLLMAEPASALIGSPVRVVNGIIRDPASLDFNRLEKPIESHVFPDGFNTGDATNPSDSEIARAIKAYAEATRGKASYKLGARVRLGFFLPDLPGFKTDCSNYIQNLYQDLFGELIPPTASTQWAASTKIPGHLAKPGDLVFFENTYKPGISHVGIYVGKNKFVHISSSKRSGKTIAISDLNDDYYRRHFAGFGRPRRQLALTPTAASRFA